MQWVAATARQLSVKGGRRGEGPELSDVAHVGGNFLKSPDTSHELAAPDGRIRHRLFGHVDQRELFARLIDQLVRFKKRAHAALLRTTVPYSLITGIRGATFADGADIPHAVFGGARPYFT
ncbi:MAG: hypothetical protein WDM77_09820 [Steroidobacteraceae bacterium]